MSDAGAASELFATETMAELCARQGRTGDAVAIYRRLLTGDVAEDRRARWGARLAALERAASARPATTTTTTTPEREGRREEALPRAATAARPEAAPAAVSPETSGPVPAATPAPAPVPGHRAPLLIDAQVRSGQIVYAQDRDLIVMAPVNPGAQLIADGHIHVYAPLRGRAVAGAHGWLQARIFCARLEAELVGIDAAYLAFEDLPRQRFGKPGQVLLRDGRCVIVPL